MSYWFFFSYARDDNKDKNWVRKVFNELEIEVSALVGVEEVGIFDKEDIPHGERWEKKIATALQTSRTFISLYSPTYFRREFCGKEWTVFHSRLELYRKETGEMPPLLLPVLWIPAELLLPTLPDSLAELAELQFAEGYYPERYMELGVRQLRINAKYRTSYQDLIFKLANKIVTTGRQYEKDGVYTLPKLSEIPPLKAVPSAFTHTGNAGGGKNSPRYVQII